MNIAIIPARKGSKRIKGKNIKNFLGKPIISYVIKKAISSKIFDYVIVSTDSLKIKKISEKCGAKVFFKRPRKISNDKAKTQEVIIHSLNWFKKKNITFNYICCIYPTSAMVKSSDLKKSLKLIKNNKWSFVMSSQKYSTRIERSFKLSNRKIVLINKKKFNRNSQTFQDFYHDAGQFYWGTSKSWYSRNIILENKSTIYELKKHQAIDINTLDDWKFAEKLYKLSN
jgi:N-acylneuraminate cytidylyltransferase